MKVSRTDAVAVCTVLGWPMSSGWNAKRMRRKLEEVKVLVEESGLTVPEDHEDRERLQGILDRIVAAEDLKVVDDKVETPSDAESGNVEAEAADAVEFPEKKAKAKAKKEKKAKKEPKGESTKEKVFAKDSVRGNPGPKIDGEPVRVKSICNRLFYAGQVLKERGLGDGLTDELVAEVDKLCKKSNQVASKTQLGYAWHVVNGYLNG